MIIQKMRLNLLLTSLIWRSNAGCCLWFRNWTNETLKINKLCVKPDVPLFTFPLVSWTWTWTYCHSWWALQPHCHFLNFFHFVPFSQLLWVFLTQNYFSDFIFIESKNEPIKVTQSFSIDRWRVDSEKESGYESKLLTTKGPAGLMTMVNHWELFITKPYLMKTAVNILLITSDI